MSRIHPARLAVLPYLMELGHFFEVSSRCDVGEGAVSATDLLAPRADVISILILSYNLRTGRGNEIIEMQTRAGDAGADVSMWDGGWLAEGGFLGVVLASIMIDGTSNRLSRSISKLHQGVLDLVAGAYGTRRWPLTGNRVLEGVWLL